MSCQHSRQSGPCSSCLGAPARKVDIADGKVIIDGQPERSTDPGIATPYTRMHGRRKQPRGMR